MIGYKTINEFTEKECNEFLNRTDISNEDRHQAEERLTNLRSAHHDPYQLTIIEEYPEYGFRPTSLLRGNAHEAKKCGKTTIRFGYCCLLLSVVMFSLMWLDQGTGDSFPVWFLLVVISIAGIGLLITGYRIRKLYMPVEEIADYYSTSNIGCPKNSDCVIYVKNRKFGVMTVLETDPVFAKVLLPAEFDKLQWQTITLLFGQKDGKIMLVDVEGDKGTKGYDRLEWKDENATEILVAENEGKRILVDVYGNELP